MSELFCSLFLAAFLLFYSALLIMLAVWGIRGALRGRSRVERAARGRDVVGEFVLSPQADRD